MCSAASLGRYKMISFFIVYLKLVKNIIWKKRMNDLFHQKIFAKNENQQFKYPIFQMRECECTHDQRQEWLDPLFSGLDFNEQWEELGRRLG